MKELSTNIIKILEDNDFSYDEVMEYNGKFFVEINQYTPEGEDWCETIWFDGTEQGFVAAVKYRADNYDVEEEAEIYIDMRGRNGVPDSIRALIEDAEWKKETLEDLSRDLAA